MTQLRLELARLTRPGRLVGFEAVSPEGARGLRHIVEGRALPFEIPLWMYRKAAGSETLEDLWLAEGAVPSPFHWDAEVPLGIGDALHEDANGTTMIGRSCFTCHAGPVAGRVVAGLPNAHLDLVPATATAEVLRRFDLLGALEERQEVRRIGDSLVPLLPGRVRATVDYARDYRTYMSEVLLPAYRHAEVRGDDTGSFGAWFMTAKIADPERTGILMRRPGDPRTAANEAIVAGSRLPPVDPEPWWNIRFKDHAYRFRDAPRHSALAFNFNFYIPEGRVDSRLALDAHRAKVAARARLVGEVLRYAAETVPPPLPPELEARLDATPDAVTRGEALFHGGPTTTGRAQRCASCHGTYRREGSRLVVDYPNEGLADVGTDPAYSRTLRRFAPLTENLARTRAFYGPEVAPFSLPVTEAGYAPPVLVGVWASAPYFHNGAVPTLADVLEPPEVRPEVWARRTESPDLYDMTRIGLAHEVARREDLRRAKQAAKEVGPRAPAALDRRRYYDTRDFGRSRDGHRYGTDLSPGEKADILAFLVSLSPNEGIREIVPAR